MQNTNRLRAVLSCGEYEEWEREEGEGSQVQTAKLRWPLPAKIADKRRRGSLLRA